MLRLIQKWLKAGVLEDGVLTVSDRGTGQGSVISPLLANVYLHYVFDLWAERWRHREAVGNVIIVRYADDLIIGFELDKDARRFQEAMCDRLREFSLSLHPEKTRRSAASQWSAALISGSKNRRPSISGFHLHLRKKQRRTIPDQTEGPTRPHAGEAQGN